MTTFPCYLDLPAFLANEAASVETASLVGGNTTLTTAAVLGATALVVTDVTGFATTGYPYTAWVLDGLNSEEVLVSNVNSGTKTLTLLVGTLAPHAAYVSVSSAGTQGSLANHLREACREVDNICQQFVGASGEFDAADSSLYAISRTEVYEAPYGGAAFDIDHTLVIDAAHFPVRSVAAISVQVGAMSTTDLGLTYLTLPNGGRTIKVPWAQYLNFPPGAPLAVNVPFARDVQSFITVTYTGGPINGATFASVPSDIRTAAALLTLDRLAFRSNPLGAAMARRGDVMTSFELRGDFAGKSMLWKDAANRLRRYKRW